MNMKSLIKPGLLAFAGLLVFAGLSRPGAVSVEVNRDFALDKEAKVAVVGFNIRGASGQEQASQLSGDFSDLMGLYLSKAGYTVIERARIDLIWREQIRQLSGLYDLDSAVRLGKIAKSRFVVFGSATARRTRKGTMSLSDIIVKSVNVESGEVVLTAGMSGSGEGLQDAARKIGEKMVKEINKKRKH